ncbi:PIN domain-containing protein [Rhodococcus sp. NPDC058505]|uniref:PIN domain-containing protein n=1 Tax=unclassified Rhodococcus (in: high G+C Gram-positive bacteria) TaxID=192944 RepID=UPI00364A1568
MSKSIVVLDTNILARIPYLNTDEWTGLYAHVGEWKLHFVVPEVVVMETVNVVRRLWRPDRNRLANLKDWFIELDKHKEFESLLAADDARHEGYEAVLGSRLAELGIEIAPLPATIDHMDIARRASMGRAPYARIGKADEGRTKDGYRDTLIWLTVLAVAGRHPECDVWFVSDNYSDFGAKNETKDQRDTLDYPLAWHSELAEELDRSGLRDRVFYARGLSRLEQHLLSKFAPLSDAERDELWAAVERSELDRRLMLALFEASVDPRSAALPLDTVSATVIGCVRAANAIRFSEAARRAAGAWTARFNCEIDATVEITSMAGDVAEESKPLVVSGRIYVNADNQVAELTIEAIEAAADDPQRRAWVRADAAANAGLSPAIYRSIIDGMKINPDFQVALENLKFTPSPDFRVALENLKFTPSPDFRVALENLKFTPPDRIKFADGPQQKDAEGDEPKLDE